MSIIDPRTIRAIDHDRLLAADRARLAGTATGSSVGASAAIRALWHHVSPSPKPGGRWGRRRYTIREVPVPQ